MKERLFKISALVLGLVLLLALELSLGYLFGIYKQNQLITTIYEDKEQKLAINPKAWSPYFTAFEPSVAFQPFSSQKAPNEFRILCLGGSSLAGFPYTYPNAFASYLQQNMQILHPNKVVRVFNLGASAINSSLIADRASELKAFKPDLVLQYLGHNELLGGRGVLSQPKWLRSYPWMGRFLAFIDRLAITSILKKGLISFKASSVDKAQNLMDQQALGVSANETHKEAIQEAKDQLLHNLSHIKAQLTQQVPNVRFALAIPVSNRIDQPPIGKNQVLQEQWEIAIQQPDHQESSLDSLLSSIKDQDPFPFRMPSTLADGMLQWAINEQIPLLDFRTKIAEFNGSLLPGHQFFTDHLHPNHNAHLWIAKELTAFCSNHFLMHDELSYTDLLTDPVLANSTRLDPLDFSIAELQLEQLSNSRNFRLRTHIDTKRVTQHSADYQKLANQLMQGQFSFSESYRRLANVARSKNDSVAVIKNFRQQLYWQNRETYPVTRSLSDWAEQTQLAISNTLIWPLLDAYAQTPTEGLFDLISATLIKIGSYPIAQQWLLHGLQENPNSIIRNYNMARLKLLMNDQEQAKFYFSKYQALLNK